jgi:hypothetical protein
MPPIVNHGKGKLYHLSQVTCKASAKADSLRPTAGKPSVKPYNEHVLLVTPCHAKDVLRADDSLKLRNVWKNNGGVEAEADTDTRERA